MTCLANFALSTTRRLLSTSRFLASDQVKHRQKTLHCVKTHSCFFFPDLSLQATWTCTNFEWKIKFKTAFGKMNLPITGWHVGGLCHVWCSANEHSTKMFSPSNDMRQPYSVVRIYVLCMVLSASLYDTVILSHSRVVRATFKLYALPGISECSDTVSTFGKLSRRATYV